MSKSIIFLVLALCLLVQSYVISKEVEPVSCFDKKSAEIQETADVQEFAKNITAEFKEIEGPASSKYELYNPICRKYEAKIMPGLKVSNYPICDETDHINANNTTKIIFGEIFFDFLCNLKEDEYKGFLKWVALIRILEVDECNRMIERKYSTHELSELCGDKIPDMLTCYQRVLIGEDDTIAFHKALTAYYQNGMCVENDTDEEYEKRYDHKISFNIYAKLLNQALNS